MKNKGFAQIIVGILEYKKKQTPGRKKEQKSLDASVLSDEIRGTPVPLRSWG